MLLRKMMRDLWNHKGTYIASMILVIVGILLYNMLSMIYEGFKYSLDKYYNEYNFADGVLKVNSMPQDALEDIKNIRGIKAIEGRIEKRVRLVDSEREVIFQFISYDSENEKRLNGIELLEGNMPDPYGNEIIIGNNYYKAMNLSIGDTISVVVNGKKRNLKISGYGRSPEFIYTKKNDNELISDPTTFDLAFMPYKSMSKMFGISDEVNNIAFSMFDKDDFEFLKTEIKEISYKYGIKEITPREDMISHTTTVQKMDGIGSITKSLPIMFLSISGIIIYIVLKKGIEQERTQIGVLKSFGISDFRIIFHYISYSLIIGITGGIIGAYFGIKWVPGLMGVLGTAFNMPFEISGLSGKYAANSFAISFLFAIASGYAGANKCIKLNPAEALRAPVNKGGKTSIIDKFYWIIEKLDSKTKVALRNIIRNKGRSLFMLFGITITSALLCFPVAMSNMYDKMLVDQFKKIETYDMKASLNSYMDRSDIIREIKNKDGIDVVEPMIQIPVEFYNGWKSEESVVIGIPINSKVYNLYDSENNKIILENNGIILSRYMAKKLNLSAGDYVFLKSYLFNDDEVKKIKINKIIDQYIGSNGYINIDYSKELLNGKDLANSLMINGSDDVLKKLHEDYNESEVIATFDYSEKIAGEFLQFMDQMTKTIGMLVLFGMVTGFSVIYVSLTISLSERNRELATMLVVGMSPREVHKILLIEQFIISIMGICLGLPLGKLMLMAFAESSSTEYLVMPSEVPFNAMVFSVVATIIAIIIPQIIGRMKINKIVVTESLNARE